MEQKLEDMVLRIAEMCSGRRNFNRTVLCRLCYYSDFDHYELRGASISGSTYVLRNGGPEPVDIDRVLGSMSLRGLIRLHTHAGDVSIVPLTPGDDVLSEEEVGSIGSTVERYGGMNERILSWKARGDAPCCGKRPSEKIDYASVSLRNCTMSTGGMGEGRA